MKDWALIRERYLRDELPVRLGGLAANLSRIKSFANNENNKSVVESLIDESKHFIEWTAQEAEIETASKLVEIQVQLARWHITLDKNWLDINHRKQMSEKSIQWSQEVISSSGLLD
ncbi:MAG: hypothetical protein JNK81_06240 [Anaerolineales bacterium]|nr:hypothetical protein [Anaerolineales bacterium]